MGKGVGKFVGIGEGDLPRFGVGEISEGFCFWF